MKKIFYIGLVIIGFTSCSKLEQDPVSTVGPEAVFNSESGLKLYSNSFYNVLPSTTSIIRGDNMSDITARKDVPDFFRPGAYGPRQSTGWSWSQLRNINYFIEKNKSQEISPAIRAHYTGVAKFFRAWFYFDKVKRFGDVPWINKALDVEDDDILYGERDSRTLVMDSIIADLDYAIQHINTVSDDSRSLITPHVAAAFQSRVALFEGTFRKYHTEYNLQETSKNFLMKAVEAAEMVMNQGRFSLNNGGSTPYRNLFTSKSVVSSEVILANLYDENLGILHDANWYYTSSTYGDRLNLTRRFVNTYLNSDGTPFSSRPGYRELTFQDEVMNRDHRLSQTIRTPGYERVIGGQSVESAPAFSYTYTGYQPIKWVLDDDSYDSGGHNDNIIPIIRYSEILLNYAEAKAEMNELTDSDWNNTIGALRRRADITGGTTSLPTIIDTYLQREFYPEINDPILLEVRRERGIELALEGFRFYDLVRWAKGELVEKPWNGIYVPSLNTPMDLNQDGKMDVSFYQGTSPNPIQGVTYVDVSDYIRGENNPMQLSNTTSGEIIWLGNIPIEWKDKFYLYPIPEADRLINPSLGQNPGW